jgi:PAS domain S-box-containing protein
MGRFDDILPAWPVLGLGGVGAIALAGWYASTAETIDELLLLALAPLFLAGGLLVTLGYRSQSLPTGEGRVAVWTVLPAAAVGAAGDLVLAEEFGIALPESVPVVATITSVAGAAGAVGGFLSARQEAVVAEAEARAERAERLMAGVDGLVLARLDAEGFVETWSDGAEAITGYPAEEVVGSRLDAIYAGDDADEVVRSHLQRAIRTDGVELERTFQRRDGGEFHGSGTLTAVQNGDDLLGYVLVLADRTEERERRDQLERRNNQLEAFASVVSHDLRNPLNVAIGNIGMARKKEDDQSQLESAEEALERMEQLIEDVLALARQGKDVDEFERVELSETVQLAWGTIDQKRAEMSYSGLSAITADGERLRRLFENLFRNAIEHGGEDVGIFAGMLDDGEGFYIADNGPGIPEHKRDEIFEAGYTTGEEGTGLGLAIVRSIVEAHGWEIAAAESADGGARFDISGVQTLADVQA